MGALFLVGLGFSAPLAYSRFEPATWFYDVVGVDLSHHQGHVDWSALKGSSVAFAYMKATEGGDFRDPMFEQNWRSSAKVNLPRGAYHFFTQCRSGKEQAQNFIQTVPVDLSALPHVVDAEHMGPCRLGPAVVDVGKEIKIFIDMIEEHYGQRPLIYTTRRFHDAHLGDAFSDEAFWLRSIIWPPTFGPDRWVLWQFHNYGRRPGVKGPLDLNVYAGTPNEFRDFVGNSRHSALRD